jgi:radical SAM superfamily enzyme YgiQ (UPF0313 family)
MNILLILPRDSTYCYRGCFRRSISYAPLTLTTLAALVPPELGADITIVDEGVQPSDYTQRTYDVVGITCVTAAAPRAYKLSAHFRQQGSFVVLGGVHPTLNPEEAAQHADVVITGFAERTWPRLLLDLSSGERPHGILHETAPDVLSAPPPRRDLQRQGAYIRHPTVIAARGCRNGCSYCSIQALCEHRACTRPVEEVIDEIRATRHDTVIFLDPNLAAEHDYAMALMEALIPLNIQWASSATIDFAEDKELRTLLRRSGCMGLLIGIDSVSQESMDAAGKQFNQVSRYATAVRTLQQQGVAVMACFIFGFDGDTSSIFDETLAFIDEAQPDLMRFGVLTPFPGTREFLNLKAQGRILTEDWSRYDTQHVVFEPRHMSPATLQSELIRVWNQAYAWPRIGRRVRRAGKRWPLSVATNVGFRYYAKRVGKTIMP